VAGEALADEAQFLDLLGGHVVALQLAGEVVEAIYGLVGGEGSSSGAWGIDKCLSE